jgi:site-specific recombinase XerD
MHLVVNVRVVKTRLNKKGEWPLYYRTTIGGRRAEICSGYSVQPKYWDDISKSIKKGNVQYDAVAACVEADKAKLLRLYSEFQVAGKAVSPEDLLKRFQGKQQRVPTLLQALDQLMDEYLIQIGSPGFSKGRYKRYEVFRRKMVRFLANRFKAQDVELDKLSIQFIIGYELFLKTQDQLDISTVGVYLKIFKRLINFSISQEWLDSDPFTGFRCKSKKVDRPYLIEEELKTLEDKTFSTDRLSIVRDLFVFCCYTGLSYIDLYKLAPKDIVKGVDGNDWLSIHRTKTGEACRVPILDRAGEIIARYKDFPESQYKGKLLPVRANQKLNEYLKEIADLCGIKKNVTFHVARHTFATTVLLNKGISLETASKLLGHSNIRTTQIYARMTDTRIAQEMNVLNHKLNKQ